MLGFGSYKTKGENKMIEPIKCSFLGRRLVSKEDIRIIPSSNPTDLEKSIEQKNILQILKNKRLEAKWMED